MKCFILHICDGNFAHKLIDKKFMQRYPFNEAGQREAKYRAVQRADIQERLGYYSDKQNITEHNHQIASLHRPLGALHWVPTIFQKPTFMLDLNSACC